MLIDTSHRFDRTYIDLVRAVWLNRHYARTLEWSARITQIARLLGFNTYIPDEFTLAQAVARWQKRHGLPSNGVLGPITWSRISYSLSRGDDSAFKERNLVAESDLFSEAANDPVAETGQLLWKRAPAGVKVAIYDSGEPEQKRAGIEWAKREDAMGVKANKIEAAELSFGKAFADTGNIGDQLTKLATALKSAVDSVQAPPGITPLAGTGPHLVRTLALFTHGTSTWIGVGNVNISKSSSVVNAIAAALTVDAKIVIYGCSAARGQKEKAENWVVNTMESGGEDSLAAKLRDALIDQGKSMSSVWSHTEVGHTTRNPSLRYFNAADGKGAKGHSYAGEFVFGTVPKILALGELEETVRSLGYSISDGQQENFKNSAYIELTGLMYQAYVGAVVKWVKGVRTTNLTYRDANLPEMATLFPLEVADIIRKYWSDVYWTKKSREDAAMRLIKKMGLKK